MEGAISQLQSLQLRNGYNRPTNAISRQNNKQQNWTTIHATGVPVSVPVNYTMHMVDPMTMPMNMRKSTAGSDSGSSTGEASPPPMQPDPSTGLHGNANHSQSSGSLRKNQPLNLSRLNGGKHGAGGSSSAGTNSNNNHVDFNTGSQPNMGTLMTSNSSGNLSVLIGGQVHNFQQYRTLPPHQQPQQQRQFQGQPNGEQLLYTFNPPYLQTQTQVPVIVTSVSQRASPSAVPVPTPYPTNKMVQSCFNCGSTSHTGLHCSEASMEDVTRSAGYKLDYTISTPMQLQFMTPLTNQMTTSASSSSLNQSTGSLQPTNNNEPDNSIAFIDLTQDTTSSSSSSSSTSSIHGAK